MRPTARFQKWSYCDWPWTELQNPIRWPGSTETQRSDHSSAKIGNQVVYLWFNMISFTGWVYRTEITQLRLFWKCQIKNFILWCHNGGCRDVIYAFHYSTDEWRSRSWPCCYSRTTLWFWHFYVYTYWVISLNICKILYNGYNTLEIQSCRAFFPWGLTWTACWGSTRVIDDFKYCHDLVTSR